MQSGGGPLQPGPSVMRGLGSGTPTSSQQQSEMQKMQSQPPLMNQPYQPPNMFRSGGANQNTRPPRAMAPAFGTFIPTILSHPIQYTPRMSQWNYASMAGVPFPQQYFLHQQHMMSNQHQQNRRNPGAENNLVNVNSNYSGTTSSNGSTNQLNPLTTIPQMSQVQMPPGQPPNQQSSPMGVSHDLLVMQQMHPPPPNQHTPQPPQGVPGGAPGQSPMDQHQPNPAQVNVGAPQPHHAMMPQLQLAHLAAQQAAPPAKVNKKRQRGSRAIPIINPDTQEDVLDKYYDNDSTPSTSSTTSTTVVSTSGPPPSLPAVTGSLAPPPQSANYSTIPPNVAQVPLNPPVVDSEYDNYPPHPHQGTPELPGGMMLHHQAPPHLHHPPPNHPPPPTHVHPVPGQMYEMGRSSGGQQQQHELVYTGMKTVNPPTHLPPPPHHGVVPSVVPTAAEMTTASGTPVVSANANTPSVEIKSYQQKKKKPIIEPPPQQVILQQPPPSVQQPPPQHPLQHHLPANINQPPPSMTETMPIPYSGGIPERYRTFSEKSIAESTLSTDAEPFVYTGPTSINHHQQQPRLEEMPQQQPVVLLPEVPPPMVVVPMMVPEQQLMPPPQQQLMPPQQQQQQEIPVTINKTEMVEDKRTVIAVDLLATSMEKLNVEEQPTETAGGGYNNNKKNKQQKKRSEEMLSSAVSETSSISNKDSGSSKAPATTATTTTVVVEQQKPEPVDETDRSAVVSVVMEPHQQSQQSSSSSLISNLVEHTTSKLDNDNINNNVDCTSTTITNNSDTKTTANNNVVASSPMEGANNLLQPVSTLPKMLMDGENNVEQPEFDANKNVVMVVESTVAPVAPTSVPSKESTPVPIEQQPTPAKEPSPEPQTAATLKAPAIAPAPIKKSRSLNLIEYEADQWSPENPTGKKKYSYYQLMQLKNSAPAQEKPLNLPNWLERSNHSSGHSMGGLYGKSSNFSEMTLMPNFMKDRMGGGNMNPMRQPYPPKRPSQQGNQSGSQPNKQSQQGMTKTGSKIIRLQLDEEVKLNECENAWRPSHLLQTDNLDDSIKKTQELFKKFRSVLNKLTPDNFDKLVQQVKSFVIDTDDRLEGCIKLVFEKAISEPNFSEAYAKMCKEIGTIAILASGDKRNNFKSRLLAQCQAEFEKRRNDQTSAIRDNRIKLEANKNLAKQEFEELKAQLEEEEQNVRRRAVGTVRFIGELYKHGQLTISIMHSCIKLLIEKDSRDYDEETLECLCKLLTTIGSKMEKDHQQELAPYFEKMNEMVRNKDKYRISSRIRFMIQDVIDLRRNVWQPRRQDLNPKTMNQIQKEAETEQLQINMSYLSRGGDIGRGNRGNMQGGGSKMSGSMNSGGYGQGSLGRGGNQGSMKGGRMQTDDDGFQQISNNRNNRQQQLHPIDPKKINIPSNLDVTARLGSAANYQGWKNNSNMYAALNNEENQVGGGGGGSSMMDRDGDRDRDRRDRDRGGDRDRDRNQRDRDRDRDRDRSGSHNKNSGSYHKGSMERERYNRYGSSSSQNDDRMNRSSREPSSGSMRPMSGQHSNNQMHDRERDRGKMPPQQQQQPPSMQGRSSQQRHIPPSNTNKMGPPSSSGGSALTKSGSGQLYQQQPMPQFAIPKDVTVKRSFPEPDDAMEEKLSKFSNFINPDKNIERIVKILEEHDIKPEYYHAAIEKMFMDNIERDLKSREMVALGVSQMFEEKVITKAEYLHALEKMFQIADDLIIDMPQLYKYFAAFYVTLLKQQYINLVEIRNVAQCILPEYGATMLKELLRQYETLYGKDETVMLWCESSVKLTDFIKMSSTDAEKYLTDANLGYLLDSSSKSLDLETVSVQIKKFLMMPSISYMDVYSWVSNYVGTERSTSNEFIRTLTRTAVNHCINNKTKLNLQEMEKCVPLLQKYIDNKAARELQALYAIQRLVVELEHPQNLLYSILEHLYGNDVILDGFNLWLNSKDPAEESGKGVCLKGITQFMTMFMENSSEEEN